MVYEQGAMRARGSWFYSLRFRLTFLVALAVLPVLGLTLYSTVEQRRLAGLEVQETALRLARLASSRQGQMILGTRQLLTGLAQLREVREANGAACRVLFADLLKAYPLYSNLGAIDLDGRLYCSALPMADPVNLVDRSYFQRALKAADFAIGDYQIGRVTKTPTLNFGYPIRDIKGDLQGVVYAAVSLSWLNQVIRDADLPDGSTLSVTDKNGTILVRYPDPENWVGRSTPESILSRTANTFRTGVAEASEPDGIPRLIGFTPFLGNKQGGDVYVSIGIPKRVAYAAADQMLAWNLTWLGIIAVIAFAAAWFGGDLFVLRHANALVSGAKQLEKGNLTARVGPPYGHGELGELAQTFDEMAASLQKNAVLLQYQATHDALTGLSNRNFFIDHLRAEILSAEGRNKPSALLLMDLDRFKEINDTIGHDNGDLLIKSATDRLKAVVGSSGIIARLGGDEFAVFLTNGDRAAAVTLARDIMKAFEKPFILDDLPITSEVSIGIALFPEHGDFLIRRAEVAMYLAKEEKTGYAVYAPEKDTYSPERLILLTDLRHAIEENELYLAYQPKIDIQSRAVNGVEALVRWQHPRLGLVPPDQFIGLAERTGLIKPLTLWVLNEALRQRHLWRQEGIALSVAVNLSARNLEPTLPEQISALLRSYDLPSEALQIEITEGSIMRDPVHAREILNHLSELGIKIAIDDFGTGYSSLAYLSKLPVDQIKIDRSFVMNLTADENAAVIVRSTIDLGHQLELEVIAEGVENEEIINRLRALGCDCAQGYYISRPLKAPELTTWLANAT